MPAATNAAVAVLLLASCFLALAPSCNAHGFLLSPRSRVIVSGRAEWEAAGGNGLGAQPFRTYVNSQGQTALLNDQADVCGDPHQDVGYMNMVNTVTAIQATYAPGSTISVTIRLNTNHGGWFGVKICPSARSGSGLSQSCFDSYPLTNANTGYQRWWIYSAGGSDMTTNWRLPAGVSCDGGCVMQMTYRTANSCVDYCTSAECGSNYAARRNPATGQCMNPVCMLDQCSSTSRTEVFRDCTDIRITGTSTAAPTTTTTTNPPTGGVCDKCNIAVCRGGCKCDGSCNCRPSLGGSKCDKCNLAQSEGGCKCDNNCDCLSGTCWF